MARKARFRVRLNISPAERGRTRRMKPTGSQQSARPEGKLSISFMSLNAVWWKAILVVLAPFLAAISLFHNSAPSAPTPSPKGQGIQQKTGKQKKAEKEAPKDAPMPFHAGEILNYRVVWGLFSNAASVQLSVPERRSLFGWNTWHFRAVAHTANPVRTIFAIDDQFDSYTDTVTLESRQFEMHLDEIGRKVDRTLNLVPQGQSPRAGVSAVVVLPGTRDPLGALYSLRGVDWQHTPEYRVPVYDGRNLFEMRAHLEVPSEKVTVSSGTSTAARVAVHIFQYGKEVTGTSLMVWLAQDAVHTPVVMEAEIPLGSFRVELASPLP
jgi:hypothetical protein